MRLLNQPQITTNIPPLLQHLATTAYAEPTLWGGWQLTPITGGANNLLYRAQRDELDLAVKFTIRDARRRAFREYNALFALQNDGQNAAPQPLWLDETSYRQPVVVQSWLAGAPLLGPPTNVADWHRLVAHFCQIHTLTRAQCSLPLREATIVFNSGQHGKTAVFQAAKALPHKARPPELQKWLRWLQGWAPPNFSTPTLALCRNDANWRNFVEQNGRFLSVDWENSGWGDPTFEMADLITHPAYEDVPELQWQKIPALYAKLSEHNTARPELVEDVVHRIHTYTLLMLIWWLIRWSRYLYEIPRGLDQRLVGRPANWQERTQQKFAEYAEKLQKWRQHFSS